MRNAEASLDRAPDALIGLVPAASGACPRCGTSTRVLANGRGRVEICGPCGTMDFRSTEGVEFLSLRGTPLVPPVRARRDDPWRLR